MTQTIQFGLDRLISDPALRRPLAGKRLALLAHPASVTADLTHSLDALAALPDHCFPSHYLQDYEDYSQNKT